MNKSETTKELALALSKAQGEMPPAELNAVNPFLKNKYADLGSIIKTAKPVLAKHGLSLSQLPTSDGDKIGVTTILIHSSGEWIESTIMIPVEEDEKNKAVTLIQTAGIAITYLRRYSYASILGMYADDDVDGNGPKPPRKTKSKPKSKSTSNGKMSLDSASEVVNRDGVKYIDLDSEKLAHMYNAMNKKLKADDLTPEERENLEYKMAAIKVILAKP